MCRLFIFDKDFISGRDSDYMKFFISNSMDYLEYSRRCTAVRVLFVDIDYHGSDIIFYVYKDLKYDLTPEALLQIGLSFSEGKNGDSIVQKLSWDILIDEMSNTPCIDGVAADIYTKDITRFVAKLDNSENPQYLIQEKTASFIATRYISLTFQNIPIVGNHTKTYKTSTPTIRNKIPNGCMPHDCVKCKYPLFKSRSKQGIELNELQHNKLTGTKIESIIFKKLIFKAPPIQDNMVALLTCTNCSKCEENLMNKTANVSIKSNLEEDLISETSYDLSQSSSSSSAVINTSSLDSNNMRITKDNIKFVDLLLLLFHLEAYIECEILMRPKPDKSIGGTNNMTGIFFPMGMTKGLLMISDTIKTSTGSSKGENALSDTLSQQNTITVGMSSKRKRIFINTLQASTLTENSSNNSNNGVLQSAGNQPEGLSLPMIKRKRRREEIRERLSSLTNTSSLDHTTAEEEEIALMSIDSESNAAVKEGESSRSWCPPRFDGRPSITPLLAVTVNSQATTGYNAAVAEIEAENGLKSLQTEPSPTSLFSVVLRGGSDSEKGSGKISPKLLSLDSMTTEGQAGNVAAEDTNGVEKKKGTKGIIGLRDPFVKQIDAFNIQQEIKDILISCVADQIVQPLAAAIKIANMFIEKMSVIQDEAEKAKSKKKTKVDKGSNKRKDLSKAFKDSIRELCMKSTQIKVITNTTDESNISSSDGVSPKQLEKTSNTLGFDEDVINTYNQIAVASSCLLSILIPLELKKKCPELPTKQLYSGHTDRALDRLIVAITGNVNVKLVRIQDFVLNNPTNIANVMDVMDPNTDGISSVDNVLSSIPSESSTSEILKRIQSRKEIFNGVKRLYDFLKCRYVDYEGNVELLGLLQERLDEREGECEGESSANQEQASIQESTSIRDNVVMNSDAANPNPYVASGKENRVNEHRTTALNEGGGIDGKETVSIPENKLDKTSSKLPENITNSSMDTSQPIIPLTTNIPDRSLKRQNSLVSSFTSAASSQVRYGFHSSKYFQSVNSFATMTTEPSKIGHSMKRSSSLSEAFIKSKRDHSSCNDIFAKEEITDEDRLIRKSSKASSKYDEYLNKKRNNWLVLNTPEVKKKENFNREELENDNKLRHDY